ncbi:sulfite transporter Ssu2 [Mytilinidion resinicola]|uniref:Sulfite transporter Ssu2 n=1 Tax=Mytilinidion resinicola TaxID=574789 RepID=A0A6A6Y2I2_9PEZI|nr:sulfite transporter Ssu2 [Mytilinidion resinicola]KAF2802214.1 sulfite transporter Ssu2 [Mytilinidion resinicola]
MQDPDHDLTRLASNKPSSSSPSLVRQRSSHRHHTTTSDPSGEQDVIPEPPPDQLTKYDVGWRRVVRNFSPSWFSVTMGTGIVSLLFITIPFQSDWLYWMSVVFFALNTLLFALAFVISILRYTLYPAIWTVMINDSTNSLFLGTIPMGFATLVESWIFLCIPYWGPWAIKFAWVCWMIDCIVAGAVTVSLTFLLISQSHQQALDRITAAQLLPIAATIVAAGAGAEIAEVLPNPDHALGTLITSYVMWGMATPLAMTVLVIYYQRLALHKLPPREIVVSSFLPLGPLGMGGYTIMYLGKVSREVFPQVHFFHDLAVAGDIVYILGVFLALLMWGFGLIWFAFALASIYKSRPFPFNMGWWGFTFPLGVYAVSTIELGNQMPSQFFKVLGTILSVAVIFLWIVVAIGTARGAWDGKLFHAPCLANLKKDEGATVTPPDNEKATTA